jgi:hypothetical protein
LIADNTEVNGITWKLLHRLIDNISGAANLTQDSAELCGKTLSLCVVIRCNYQYWTNRANAP